MNRIIKNRVRKIFSFAESLGTKPDAIIIKNGIEGQLDSTFFYLSGIRSGLFEGCSIIAYPSGSISVLTSKLEETFCTSSFSSNDSRNKLWRNKIR